MTVMAGHTCGPETRGPEPRETGVTLATLTPTPRGSPAVIPDFAGGEPELYP